MYTASLVFMNSAPTSASVDGDMTALMICAMFSIDPFGSGMSSLFDMENSHLLCFLILAFSSSLH
jgi:hypothetical protein